MFIVTSSKFGCLFWKAYLHRGFPDKTTRKHARGPPFFTFTLAYVWFRLSIFQPIIDFEFA